MSDYYDNPRALLAAEQRLEILGAENRNLRESMLKMQQDYDAAVLRGKLESIDRYDRDVAMLIAADPRLQDAWDNFRVQYELTVSKQLLETAKEKIAGYVDETCHGCKRKYSGNTEESRRSAKENVLRIARLEARLRELGEDV